LRYKAITWIVYKNVYSNTNLEIDFIENAPLKTNPHAVFCHASKPFLSTTLCILRQHENNTAFLRQVIGKGKGHPITGHEGPTGGVEV
jgi:hypothetical protein